MNRRASPCAIALLVPVCTAQSYFTTPPGFLDKDGAGETQISHPLEGSTSKNQYMDGGQRGVPRSIAKLEMRRDAYAPANSSYVARTAMIAVILAHCDVSQPSTTFASNYVGGPTKVVQRRSFTFPALVQPPPTGPAPWSLQIVFDVPFAYSGALDLLWEIQTDSLSTSLPLSIDIEAQPFGPGFGSTTYVNPNGGCTTPNGKYTIGYPFSPGTSAGMASLRTFANQAPANAASVLALGLSDAGFLGGFCAQIRTSAEITLPVTSGAGGSIPTQIVTFPWTGGLLQVFAQFASVSGAVPQLSLSDALRFLITNDSYDPKLHRLTAGSVTAATGTHYTSMIPVTRFAY